MPIQKNTEEYLSLKKEFEKATVDIREIKDCLVGNESFKSKGLVTEHNELCERVEAIEDTFSKFKNIVIGLALGSGVGAAAIIKAIVDAFTKH